MLKLPCMSAADLIRDLALQPHPEGGWFREVYRSEEMVSAHHLPARYGAARVFSTSIYFLLEAGQFSAFHRLRSDEIWFHHAGGDLDSWRINPEGNLSVERLGPGAGRWQTVFSQGDWFAARPAAGAAFALVGCAVAPGFDFADFELARRDALSAQFPAHRNIIHQFTRI